MIADIHSKKINFHVGLTGGEINNIFFVGEMEGRVSIKNKVTLYEDSRYPHLKFRELDDSGNIRDTVSYETRGVTSQTEAHDVGKDYCENIGPRLSPYYEMLLPGYGSNVVLNKEAKKVSKYSFYQDYYLNDYDDDEDYYPMKNDMIDLSKGILKNFLLNIPIKILCSEDCEGISYDSEKIYEENLDVANLEKRKNQTGNLEINNEKLNNSMINKDLSESKDSNSYSSLDYEKNFMLW